MTIRFQCVECNSVMKIKDEKAGTTGHCPKCKTEFIVPQPDQEDAVPENGSEKVSASAKVKTAVAERPVEQTEESLEDEYQRILMGEDSPIPGSSKGGSSKGGSSKGGRSTGGGSKGEDSNTILTSDALDETAEVGSAQSSGSVAMVTTPSPSKSRPKTTAEMAEEMLNHTAEPSAQKKKGRAFGEGTADKGDRRKQASVEARNYYLTRVGLGSVGVVVACLGLYYMMSSMMGGQKYPPLGQVSGTITLDGNPLPAANVTFQPLQEGTKPNADTAGSIGISDKDGHFSLYYVADVPGAAVGKHLVQIRAQNDAGVEIVPGKYNQMTELTFEVKSGSNPAADFPLSSK
jgi:DNA-directed RNA polymerase subunit M/transcription elongation factor TFIIS